MKKISENMIKHAIRMERDHEVQMARAQLYHAAKNAVELHDLLKDFCEDQDLEGWVQSKITLAAEYLEVVKNHLEYEVISGEIPTYGDPMMTTETVSADVAVVAAPLMPKKKMLRRR